MHMALLKWLIDTREKKLKIQTANFKIEISNNDKVISLLAY